MGIKITMNNFNDEYMITLIIWRLFKSKQGTRYEMKSKFKKLAKLVLEKDLSGWGYGDKMASDFTRDPLNYPNEANILTKPLKIKRGNCDESQRNKKMSYLWKS